MVDLLPVLRDLLAVSASALAVVFDERSRRIPNALTYGTAAAALALSGLHALLSGAASGGGGRILLSSLAGGALLLVVFGVLSAIGMLGFGDTKLLCAIGLCVGLPLSLRVAVCVLLCGGAVATTQALRQGRLSAVLGNLVRPKRLGERAVTEPQPHLHLFGYALAIALGTTWAVLGRYYPALLPL